MGRIYDRTEADALEDAKRRRQLNPERGCTAAVVAVSQGHDGGIAEDGLRARVLLFDGERHVVPRRGVVVLRAHKRVDVEALADALEARSARYPRATAMDRLAADIERGIFDERLWVERKAA